MKVEEILREEAEKGSGRVTKNQELQLKLLIAVLTDDDYVAKDLKEFAEDGQTIIEEKRLSKGFKEILVAALKKGKMSEAEARQAADEFKVNKEMAKAVMEAVREADYLALEKCGKKIQLIKKPGLEINLSLADGKETVRKMRNPRDEKKLVTGETTVHERRVLRVEHVLHDFQKTVKRYSPEEIKKFNNL